MGCRMCLCRCRTLADLQHGRNVRVFSTGDRFHSFLLSFYCTSGRDHQSLLYRAIESYLYEHGEDVGDDVVRPFFRYKVSKTIIPNA